MRIRHHHYHWMPADAGPMLFGAVRALDIPEPTYSGTLDGDRLTSQLAAVQALMADGCWRSLSEIRAVLGRGSEAGLSARLRESRTRQAGGWTVLRRRRGDPKVGLWEYRLRK
jgi:hypothetical protein